MKKHLLVFMIFFSAPSFAAVTASVSSNTVASGETIELQLKKDGGGDSQPDLDPLKKDFDLLGTSSGSNVEIVNGQMTSQSEFTVTLSPKRSGKILIPSLQWGSEKSPAIELTAGGSSGQAANSGQHVFMIVTPDQQQPYVQGAVVLTVKLYSDQPLYQATLEMPSSSDVLVKPFGKDATSVETRNGSTYRVIERKYLLFPQRSGKIMLDGPVLDAHVADASDPFNSMFKQFGGMVNATKPLHLRGSPVELNVLPRPIDSANWLPAQNLTLEETWPQGVVHAGDPLTRHIKITALGLTGEQLPDPNALMTLPQGLRAYPDQASVSDSPQGNAVEGTRDQNVALIASQPGRYELPGVKLVWWDTAHKERREATLPSHVLNVLPALGSIAQESPAKPAAPAIQQSQLNQSASKGTVENVMDVRWKWASFAFALLWLATLAAWWRSRKSLQPSESPVKPSAEKQSVNGRSEHKAFKRACMSNDPHAARHHLLAWAASLWPDNPPLGLNELSRRIEDERVAETLKQLDRACYAGTQWHGKALADLPFSPPMQKKKTVSALPGLYD